jgi:SAM-dependent methyltransferase
MKDLGLRMPGHEGGGPGPAMLPGGLYDHPAYADLIFRDRTAGETAFLMGCWARHAPGRVRHVLEAACGSGRLMLQLARRGIAVTGFDSNPEAVRYCNARLVRHGLQPTAWEADLADFAARQPVDAVICMLNGIRHLPTARAVRSHLGAVSRALSPGGLYVVGLELTPPDALLPSSWRWITRNGRLTLVTDLVERSIDRIARREVRRLVLDIHTPKRWRRLSDTLRLRTYSASQFLQAVRQVPDLELVEALDLDRVAAPPAPVRPTTEDAAFIFRRR